MAVLAILGIIPGMALETDGLVTQWPPLPLTDGPVEIPAQTVSGGQSRTIKVYVCYPGRQRSNVKETTGLMLSLHNWGGTDFSGAPHPQTLANEFDVVVIGVDYYMSGDADKTRPYDFGYFQAMDALRGLYYVYQGLIGGGIPFDKTRIYGTGGSGGGNVVQMANKFAPRTFACIVDLSGMASLTDDIAFNLPGGSGLNARYSRDPNSPAYLTRGMQEIRDPGNAEHLARAVKLGNACKIVVIHGEDDGACLAEDKKRVVDAMKKVGVAVEPHFISKQDIDGKLVGDSGHGIGDRTKLLQAFATPYLDPKSKPVCRLTGPVDFERKEDIEFPTSDGTYVVSYTNGYPEIFLRQTGPGGAKPGTSPN